MIRECAPIGLSSLEDAVSVIRKQVEAIEKAVISNKDSIDDINKIIRKTRDDIDENNKQIERIANRIDDLVTGLNQEVNLRKESEARLDKKIDNATKEVDGKIKFLKGALWLNLRRHPDHLTNLALWLAKIQLN